MRTLKPDEQTLLDLITVDGTRIPRFIDNKKPEHHHAYLRIQEIYQFIYDLSYPEVLAEDTLTIYYLHFEGEFRQIKDNALNRKCQEYILKKMVGYLKHAVDNELFEAAANFKNYLNPND